MVVAISNSLFIAQSVLKLTYRIQSLRQQQQQREHQSRDGKYFVTDKNKGKEIFISIFIPRAIERYVNIMI